MAKINFSAALNGIENALKAVQELMPMARSFGLPAVVANVATIAISAIAVGHNVLERASNVKDAFSSEDETKLREMIGELQKINDSLAEQIAEEPVTDGSTGGGA